MAARRTARSVKLAEINIPAADKIGLVAAQDHGNVRRYLAARKTTLPDMIVVAVLPGKEPGSWHIDVWECPDDS